MDREKFKRIAIHLFIFSIGLTVITVFAMPDELVIEASEKIEKIYSTLMQIVGVVLYWIIRIGLWALEELSSQLPPPI